MVNILRNNNTVIDNKTGAACLAHKIHYGWNKTDPGKHFQWIYVRRYDHVISDVQLWLAGMPMVCTFYFL